MERKKKGIFHLAHHKQECKQRADVLLQCHCVHTPLEIHELHNIYVNLDAGINRGFPDELYIVSATHRRQMSKINVQSKVSPQLGTAQSISEGIKDFA